MVFSSVFLGCDGQVLLLCNPCSRAVVLHFWMLDVFSYCPFPSLSQVAAESCMLPGFPLLPMGRWGLCLRKSLFLQMEVGSQFC